MKLLFVCTGNICRSPMAEGVIKYLCTKKEYNSIVCDSAALFDFHTGDPPDIRAINILKKNNIDISNLRARKIIQEDFLKFDLIIGMDKNHVSNLKKFKYKRNSIHLYLDFINNLSNQDVNDPYYGTIKDFQKTFEVIKNGAEEIVKKFGY